jgi:hypothetical protein
MRLRSRRLIVSLACLGAIFAASCGLPADLAGWKFQPNEVLRYRRTQDRRLTTEVDDRSVEQKLVRLTDMTLKVGQVRNDGSASLTLTVDRIRLTQTAPTGDTEYDSAHPESGKGDADRLTANLGPMIGMQFSFRLSVAGKVDQAKLTEETEDRLKGHPAILNALGSPDKLVFLVPTLPFPEGGAATGQTWDEHSELADALVGTRRLHTTYTLAALSDEGGRRIAEINTSTEVSLDAAPTGPVRMVVEKQTQSGTARFDVEAGKLLSRVERDTMTSRMTMQGKELRQTVASVVTVERVPDTAPHR